MTNPYVLLTLAVLLFGGGMLTEYRFSLAAQTVAAWKATGKAQKGEVDIIKRNQKVDDELDKTIDPCLNDKPGID